MKTDSIIEKITAFLWGNHTLIFLLVAGVVVSFCIKWKQLQPIQNAKRTAKSLFNKNQFRTVAIALGATMGTGNIIGVASALTLGGAGAIFWMWISALLGMGLCYAENFLAIKHRTAEHSGSFAYISKIGKNNTFCIFYGLCCILTSLGMGCAVQSNSAALSLQTMGINRTAAGIFAAAIVGIIIIGGVKRIGAAAAVIVPFLSMFYILVSIIIIIIYRENLTNTFASIFKSAFGISEIAGGVGGFTLAQTINVGLRRGIFSNEAGLGTSALMHKDVASNDADLQGRFGIVEVFIDTILCCTLTALVILTTNSLDFTLDNAQIVNAAYSTFFGNYGGIFIGLSISLFALATMLSWAYCGEGVVKYLGGKKLSYLYRLLFVFITFVGAVGHVEKIWQLSDTFNALMLFTNISAVLLVGATRSGAAAPETPLGALPQTSSGGASSPRTPHMG